MLRSFTILEEYMVGLNLAKSIARAQRPENVLLLRNFGKQILQENTDLTGHKIRFIKQYLLISIEPWQAVLDIEKHKHGWFNYIVVALQQQMPYL